MAAVIPRYVEQPQAPVPVPAPTASAQDPLYEALVQYITSGVDAQSISPNEIQGIYQSITSEPQGTAFIEGLVSTASLDTQGGEWRYETVINTGRATTTTSEFAFEFGSSSAKVYCSGKTSTASKNGNADLGGGLFYCNDFNAVRHVTCDFFARILNQCNRAPTLVIDFSSNGDPIGRLEVEATYLTISPRTNGSATFK